jgi:hypothetical protein
VVEKDLVELEKYFEKKILLFLKKTDIKAL